MLDFLAVNLARRNLEHESGDPYKGFVVRSWLKGVPNEAMKCRAFTREEEMQKFLHLYIEFVKSPDGHVLRSNLWMRKAFRTHFRDRFARLPDLLVQEFCCYLTDFLHLHLQETGSSSCEGLVTEYEVRDALKVGFNKSSGLNGLPYEV